MIIYLMTLAFPVISIVCGVATLGALVTFVLDIQRDIHAHRP